MGHLHAQVFRHPVDILLSVESGEDSAIFGRDELRLAPSLTAFKEIEQAAQLAGLHKRV